MLHLACFRNEVFVSQKNVSVQKNVPVNNFYGIGGVICFCSREGAGQLYDGRVYLFVVGDYLERVR